MASQRDDVNMCMFAEYNNRGAAKEAKGGCSHFCCVHTQAKDIRLLLQIISDSEIKKQSAATR